MENKLRKGIALLVVFTITLQMTANYSNIIFATEQNPVTVEDVKAGSKVGETLDVIVDGVEGVSESTIKLGDVVTDEIKNQYDGYAFINATVGDVEISGVGKYNEDYYYCMNDVNSAYLLNDKQVVLHYQKVINIFTVNYEYDATVVNVVSEKTVKEGENVSFRVELLDNQYRITSISANGVSLVADQKGYCVIEKVIGDVSVIITTEIIQNYNVNSDNRFIGNMNMQLEAKVVKGNTDWFTLGTINTASDTFNSIFVNGEYLDIETPMWEWETVITRETTLKDGTQIRVTSSREYKWGAVKYEHRYTISVKNASSDLNFVPAIYRTPNISFLEIDGVQVYRWNGKELETIPAGALILKGNNTDIFFVDTQAGYDASANLSGEGSKVIEKISAVSDVKNVENGYAAAKKAALAKGCDYTFFYSDRTVKHRKVEITSNLVNYNVTYDLNNGMSDQAIIDQTVYTILAGENIVKVSDIIPTREGYTFNGWELIDTEVIYQANNEIVINEVLFYQLKSDKIKLKAQWILDKDVKTSSYTVKHFFEQEDGSYAEDEKLTTKIVNAPVNEKAIAIPKEGILNYVYNSEIQDNKLVGIVTNDGKLGLEVYYSFQKNTVTYDVGGALSGSAPVDVNSPYKIGSEVIVLANSGNLVGAFEGENAEFVCWSTSAEKTNNYYFPKDVIEIKTNTILYAVFVGDLKNSSTLSFTAGTNGKLVGNTKFVVPANLSFDKVIGDESFLANAVADELYLFDGWYFSNNKIASTNTELFNVVKTWNYSGEIEARFVEDSKLKHDISYTVNYYTGDTLKDTEEVVDRDVTQATKTLKVRHLDTSNDKFAGYSYVTHSPSGIKDGDIVNDKTVINVNYVKDESKTHELSYTLLSYKGNSLEDAEDAVPEKELIAKTVWAGANSLLADEIDLDKYDGYKFVKSNPAILGLVNHATQVQIYYVKDSDMWTKVEFSAGTHGLLNDSMESVISDEVLIGKTFESQGIEIPTINAEDGWLVADDEWDVRINNETIIEKDLIITAQYTKKAVNPVEPDSKPTPEVPDSKPTPEVPDSAPTVPVVPTQGPIGTTVVIGVPELFRSVPIAQNAQADENVQIDDNQTPKAKNNVTISETKSTLAQWSLFNLLFTIATLLLGMFIILSKIRNDNNDNETSSTKLLLKVVSGIILLTSIVCFVFTQNMSTIMVAFDKWSILMAALLMMQLGLMVFIRMDLKSHKKLTQEA